MATGDVFMVPTAAPSPLWEGSTDWGDVLQVRVSPARRCPPGLRHEISQGDKTSLRVIKLHSASPFPIC